MTGYLIKKQYGIETGAWVSATDNKTHIVVLDVISHVWIRSKQLPGAITDPFVVYRSLAISNDKYERLMIRLSDLKRNFKKE